MGESGGGREEATAAKEGKRRREARPCACCRDCHDAVLCSLSLLPCVHRYIWARKKGEREEAGEGRRQIILLSSPLQGKKKGDFWKEKGAGRVERFVLVDSTFCVPAIYPPPSLLPSTPSPSLPFEKRRRSRLTFATKDSARENGREELELLGRRGGDFISRSEMEKAKGKSRGGGKRCSQALRVRKGRGLYKSWGKERKEIYDWRDKSPLSRLPARDSTYTVRNRARSRRRGPPILPMRVTYGPAVSSKAVSRGCSQTKKGRGKSPPSLFHRAFAFLPSFPFSHPPTPPPLSS